ncbi:hypothetical protein DM860_000217 [Cuscuta australis]|uniref:Late embryogenesis abundant protein LEA-2 subgroup domain-containing protein n=1 Tax=Cuscuta australis TaxID=267555 RepID=A0A328D0Y0_9ASTE|nr:hypothetical protein DM860_000217 [Cuscuta australis]
MADSPSEKKSNLKWECVMACGALLLICAIVGIIVGVLEALNPDRSPKLPEYTVTKAVLSPNAAADQSLLTADFTFTLNVSNPNRKKTIFFDYDDSGHSQVNISSSLVVHPAPAPTSSEQQTINIASGLLSSSIRGSPSSSLGPNQSSDVTISLRAQNVPLPVKDDNYATTVILTMSFRARFHRQKSNYKQLTKARSAY